MTEPATLTVRDKLRRMAIVLVVLACIALMALAVNSTREVDANGDPIPEAGDPNDVEISGDESLFDDQPVGVASGGPGEAEIVERFYPTEGAEILQQQQIGVDLGDRYEATSLSLQGRSLPETELVRRNELNQVFFQPGEGLTFEELPPGPVCAQAEVALVATGEPVRTVEWCFEVT